jgi:hypothetical protein
MSVSGVIYDDCEGGVRNQAQSKLLSLRLRDLTTAPGKSLKAVMDEIGARAEACGLTPEILDTSLS